MVPWKLLHVLKNSKMTMLSKFFSKSFIEPLNGKIILLVNLHRHTLSFLEAFQFKEIGHRILRRHFEIFGSHASTLYASFHTTWQSFSSSKNDKNLHIATKTYRMSKLTRASKIDYLDCTSLRITQQYVLRF